MTPFTGGPEGPGPRAARLEHLIFEEVDRLFRMEIRDRRLQGVGIHSLRLSPDLRNAKIYFALADGEGRTPQDARREAEVKDALLRVTPFLRARVAEALGIKRTPDLHFHRDRMAEAALRAEAVLQAERMAQRAATAAPAAGGAAEEGEAAASAEEEDQEEEEDQAGEAGAGRPAAGGET